MSKVVIDVSSEWRRIQVKSGRAAGISADVTMRTLQIEHRNYTESVNKLTWRPRPWKVVRVRTCRTLLHKRPLYSGDNSTRSFSYNQTWKSMVWCLQPVAPNLVQFTYNNESIFWNRILRERLLSVAEFEQRFLCLSYASEGGIHFDLDCSQRN